jgi:hypothetical protein
MPTVGIRPQKCGLVRPPLPGFLVVACRGERAGEAGCALVRLGCDVAGVGVVIGKRAVTSTAVLTAQEAQIARLAADNLSNPEIGTRPFLSPGAVQ